MEFEEKVQKIFDARQARYGTFIKAHENLGLEWTGIIQNHFRIKLPRPIPSHVVLLMMVASKLNRAVAEELLPDQDNYIDAKIYTAMAQKARLEYEKEKAVDKESRPEKSDSKTH